MGDVRESLREMWNNRKQPTVLHIDKVVYLQRINERDEIIDNCLVSSADLQVIKPSENHRPGVALIINTKQSKFKNLTECNTGDRVRIIEEDTKTISDVSEDNILDGYEAYPQAKWEDVFSIN